MKPFGQTAWTLGIIATTLTAGCGNPPPPAEPTPPVASVEPTPAPVSAAPVVSEKPVASAEPAPETPKTPQPSGRPPVVYERTDKISESIGATPATKLMLKNDSAWFRAPEHAVGEGFLVTFMIDKKPLKKAKGGVGTVYRIQAQVPPSEDFATLTSHSSKFELRLPTAKVSTPHLAVGALKKDDKGKESLEWVVLSPTKTEEGFATFEIESFADSILQITSSP